MYLPLYSFCICPSWSQDYYDGPYICMRGICDLIPLLVRLNALRHPKGAQCYWMANLRHLKKGYIFGNFKHSQNAGLRPAMLAIAVSVRRGS